MIDIHSHYLYGVDDGAPDLSTSLKMLNQAKETGISKLVATPHVDENISPQLKTKILQVFNELTLLNKEQNLNIELVLAAEIFFNAEMLTWAGFSWALLGEKEKYILFELPLNWLPKNVSDTIFELSIKRVWPILAHPERNIYLQENPKYLFEWIKQGCLIQINAGSLLGRFGKKCKIFTEKLLKGNAVHIIASDAHDPENRNYLVMEAAFNRVVQLFDPDYANLLFVKNPHSIIKGEKLSPPALRENIFRQNISRKILRKLKFSL